jgi:hypothetical protein
VTVNRKPESVSANACFTFTEAGNCPVVIVGSVSAPSGVWQVIEERAVFAVASPAPETSTLVQIPPQSTTTVSADTRDLRKLHSESVRGSAWSPSPTNASGHLPSGVAVSQLAQDIGIRVPEFWLFGSQRGRALR